MISVRDLKPGDRVILNCPKSRATQRHMARFEGIFDAPDAMASERYLLLMSAGTLAFISAGPWAAFFLRRGGVEDTFFAFRVEEDGALREEEGKRVVVERRVTVAVG